MRNRLFIAAVTLAVVLAALAFAWKSPSGDEPTGSSSAEQRSGAHAVLGESAAVLVRAPAGEGYVGNVVFAPVADDLLEVGAPPTDGEDRAVVIDYPLDGSVFPPEIVAPTFLWHDPQPEADTWLIEVEFESTADSAPAHLQVLVRGDPPAQGEIDADCLGPTNQVYEPTPYQASARSWTPDAAVWGTMKRRSVAAPAHVAIHGFVASKPGTGFVSSGSMRFTTSSDPVGAPVFYRDVPLMPARGEAGVIKPLSTGAMPFIAWRLRDVSQPQGRVLLKSMPSCANCHSFARDGKTLGMDIDGPQGDKGAYALVSLKETTTIETENLITWNSFPDKPEGHKTIGFLSRVSPDGQYVVSTVNEALYVANFLDYRFLQVFYPTRGILAYYSRERGEMRALPGADDPAYVHCDPAWTPDGRTVVFARAEAKDPYLEGRPLATYANDPNETPIQYDLYRIPFDEGRGGRAEAVAGASANGMSNTFPKVSPDGRWIVFVKCRNGQLMRPDGRLWIVPAQGGEAREMTCNTSLMNSWHSFSPNGRWLVFSSKVNTPYTQMFLTHIDEDGRDSPPILVPHATASNRAVNIPEFLNAPYDSLMAIDVPAVNHYRDVQRGLERLDEGKVDEAMEFFHKALEQVPDFADAHINIGTTLTRLGKLDAAIDHYEQALAADDSNALTHTNLGFALGLKGERTRGIQHLERALEIYPHDALAHNNLGFLLFQEGRRAEAIEHYQRALVVDPAFLLALKNLGMAYLAEQRLDDALAMYARALVEAPDDTVVLSSLGRVQILRGEHAQAVAHLRRVVELRPDDVRSKVALAWQLATSPQDDVRDGQEALKLAEQAAKETGRQQAEILDALAAAYAEVGRFGEAGAACREAARRLRPGQTALQRGIRQRLELYRAGKPFRASPPSDPPGG